MKLKYTLILITLVLSTLSTKAQTLWQGPSLTFTKSANADWKMESNQDRITDSVWITRAANKGLFNIYTDSIYTDSTPTDTEWAFGNTSDTVGLTFKSFFKANNDKAKPELDKAMILHIISEDIYIDIKFKSWGASNSGGFSYERSTPGTMNVLTNKAETSTIKLYPNPTQNSITLSGLGQSQSYTLYNHLGVALSTGVAANNKTINIQNLATGAYHIQLENGEVLRFTKN